MRNDKIKILQTIRQGKFGGGETHVLELSTRLDRTKYEVIVLSFSDGPMMDELNARGIRNRIISSEKAFDPKTFKQVENLLIEEKIDLIHAHGSRACSNVLYIARRLKIPVIYTVHGWSFHPDQNFLVKRLRIWSEKLLTRFCERTICVSKSNQQEGERLFGLKRSEVVYNAVDFTRFDPDRDYVSLRNKLGIPREQIVIGYIVRITRQKDPLTLIKAFSRLVQENMNVTLLVVGDGDLKEEMHCLAENLGVMSQVVFLPFRSDIPVVLNAIDIYCLPSLWEGFPIGILEAMAMRKTVVTTPVNGNTELVTDGETGWLTPVADIEKLASTLISACENLHMQSRMAENGYHFVRNNYSYDKLLNRICSIYDEFHLY